ncbi:MAG: nucleoside triphosphate pyrophosphohydrolase family protein [Clostridia bacterium]|nr:nucleoside triphosphate pyrophosphohydrolase family protein [Clostridia bacterium]
MTVHEYQEAALRTLNPNLGQKDVLINGVMGLCGESGEAIDLVKKHLAQGHPLDKAQLANELGDIAWYLAETAAAIGYDLETVLEQNIEKLKRRYPEGFDPARSLQREKE